MVATYTRYEHSKTFGVIVSGQSNVVYINDTGDKSAGKAISAALEQVIVWDIKKGEKIQSWYDSECKAEVTYISHSPSDGNVFAVGYADGSIRLWALDSGHLIVTLNGHRSAITALSFDLSGTRLASGSRDTNVVVWDVVAEVGVSRLKGHRDQVTEVLFLSIDGEASHLVTTSKDSFLKLWDLTTSHCVETYPAHRGETWAMALSHDARTLVTAGLEGELKLWSIAQTTDFSEGKKHIVLQGTLQRTSKVRPATLSFHPSGEYLASQGVDKAVEIFRLRSAEEVQKLLKRRKKRKRDKHEDDSLEEEGPKFDDNITPYVTIRTSAKIRSLAWGIVGSNAGRSTVITFLAALNNNSLEVYSVPTFQALEKGNAVPDYEKSFSLDIPGHQADIRAISLSSASDVLASASSGSLKLWNVKRGACIRSFDCDYALCISFLLNDKFIVVGTKEGDLQLFDVAGSTLIETIKAHEGALWSLQVHPDGRSLISGSADKSVKFWRFETVDVPILGTKRSTQQLTLKHARTLKLTDDVLSLKLSPDCRLLAVALLDSTVKVFFADTLKFFLSLYGHKLPVLNMDISSDNKLLATCSADKNVKLWGLDFGDCHKSIFAHSDSILQVQFEKGNHNFFTSSRDKTIKYWDGDKFENILKLDGHHAEVSAIAISGDNEFIASAGHDKSIRVWRQSDDPVFLEEEREKELEDMYESQLADSLQRSVMDGEDGEESGRAGQATMGSLMDGEKIMEALDVAESDRLMMLAFEKDRAQRPTLAMPQRSAILVAMGNVPAEKHVLNVAQKVRASHLEDALLVLPFEKVVTFFTFLDIWASKEWNMPLTTRILMLLLQMHHAQIVSNRVMRTMLDSVRTHLRNALQRQKDVIGFNLAAMQYIKREWAATNQKDFAEPSLIDDGNKKKRGFTTLL